MATTSVQIWLGSYEKKYIKIILIWAQYVRKFALNDPLLNGKIFMSIINSKGGQCMTVFTYEPIIEKTKKNNFSKILRIRLLKNGTLVIIGLSFLAHLAKDNVSFCHHLFKYCYKYCYSDSRRLWAIMKGGGLAL